MDYWEAKVEAVLDYFRCEQSLRKAISIIRRVGTTLIRPKELPLFEWPEMWSSVLDE